MESHASIKRAALIGGGIVTVLLVMASLPFFVTLFLLYSVIQQPIGEEDSTVQVSSIPQQIGEVKYANIINEAAKKYGLDPALIAAVIKQESGFDPNIRSSAGAIGVMQVMPFNAHGANLYDPRQNIMRGCEILAANLKKYKGNLDLALAAYNAGQGAVDHYHGIPPYRETQDYVRNVKANYEYYKKYVHQGTFVVRTNQPVYAMKGGKMMNPVPGSVMTSPFGQRPRDFHKGVDLAAPIGTPIYAALDGVVAKVKNDPGGYGYYIVLDHGNGLTTLYAHMWSYQVRVKVGQHVTKGTQIGSVGNNGESTGPHCHFEVRVHDQPVNPAPYVSW